jgi:hypothetical protein
MTEPPSQRDRIHLVPDTSEEYLCQGCGEDMAVWRLQRFRGKAYRPYVFLHLCDICVRELRSAMNDVTSDR